VTSKAGTVYDADYFLHGKQTGKSLYENYRWLPRLTIPMVSSIISHLGIGPDDTILDFGCARGYVVRAFRELGYSAWGLDTSEWAVNNCDPNVRGLLFLADSIPDFSLRGSGFDWVIAKDVLEHIPEAVTTIADIMSRARLGVFAVVPLSWVDGGRYVVPSYEADVTHVHRLTLGTWAAMFMKPGWRVEASYRVRGVKDNYANYAMGNGFITARRIIE
jgi:SAM-dependent methyltransferase